jgi:hypothetical protein
LDRQIKPEIEGGDFEMKKMFALLALAALLMPLLAACGGETGEHAPQTTSA